ncbi:hypothetical protein G6F22_017695 [Rhizopus arrhizus]|nr:hypothetical protein G6F22_017695 [Rhizopus arrhizus]
MDLDERVLDIDHLPPALLRHLAGLDMEVLRAGRATAARGLRHFDGAGEWALLEICQDVLWRLQPHGQAQQPFGQAVLLAVFCRIAGVRHRRGMLDQRFRVAQADGDARQFQAVQQGPPRSEPALELEGHQAAAGRLLAARDLRAGGAFQARIEHVRHGPVLAQQLGHLQGRFAMAKAVNGDKVAPVK